MVGPLEGIKVLEFEGMGPGPFAGMLLADMGANVMRIDRPSRSEAASARPLRLMGRGKQHIPLNLKASDDFDIALQLVEQADVLIDCYRPGVMERLGLGPDACLARRPALIYARMTGWGQTGPLSSAGGHDLNYLAIAGALNSIGRADQPPTPPLNLVADFGGGGMLVAFGIVCALLAARETGRGDVVDAAMIDGSALLMTSIFEMLAAGEWTLDRGKNLLDSGAPFYDVYETRDGKFVAVSAIEVDLFATFLQRIGLPELSRMSHADRSSWPATKEQLASRIATKTQQEWVDLLQDDDVCFSPVLSMTEAQRHPHNIARGAYIEVDGVVQPRPAPRFEHSQPREPKAGRAYSAEDPESGWTLSPAHRERALPE